MSCGPPRSTRHDARLPYTALCRAEAPLERAPARPTLAPRTAPVADHAALETRGARLLAAEFPVVLADRYAEGGTAMANLVEFAELLGAPVEIGRAHV